MQRRILRSEESTSVEDLGSVYTWWRGDPLPQLGAVVDFGVEVSPDLWVLAEVNALSVSEVEYRIANGNQPYLALIRDVPVGYGWSARQWAEIGALDLEFQVGEENRYLWDFQTLPPWRGRGVYPHLLQFILSGGDAERYWIGHDTGNAVSGHGILRAGFSEVGRIMRLPSGEIVLQGYGERAEAGATLLGVPLVTPSGTTAYSAVEKG